MNEMQFKLLKAPIIEAVLDIDCDLPPGRDIAALEVPAHASLRQQYPVVRPVLVQTHQIQQFGPDKPPAFSLQMAVSGLQFLSSDQRQLVQYRAQGYSFNRLAPYTSLDDYLPEIQRTWQAYVTTAAPVQIRGLRLRYINRIELPTTDPKLELEDYLKLGPRLPEAGKFTFTGFLNQYSAVENDTGYQVNIVLTAQPPDNNAVLPLIFDIMAESHGTAEVDNWPWLLGQIQALRSLKNRVFGNTLTEKCLKLFQR